MKLDQSYNLAMTAILSCGVGALAPDEKTVSTALKIAGATTLVVGVAGLLSRGPNSSLGLFASMGAGLLVGTALNRQDRGQAADEAARSAAQLSS